MHSIWNQLRNARQTKEPEIRYRRRDMDTHRCKNRVILGWEMRSIQRTWGSRGELEIGRATTLHQSSMKSSELHSFSYSCLNLMPINNFIVVVNILNCRSCSHQQRKKNRGKRTEYGSRTSTKLPVLCICFSVLSRKKKESKMKLWISNGWFWFCRVVLD